MRKWFKPLWQGVRLCWLLMVAALALAGQAVDNGDSLVAQGIALREQGDLQKSIDLLSSASKLAVSPGGQVRARGELGISLLQAHRYEESEGLLREAYASSTGVERAHFAVYLGNLALIRKRSEEARGYYQEALGLAPEAIEIQFSVRLNLLRMAPEPEKLAQLLLLSQQIDQAGGPPGPLARFHLNLGEQARLLGMPGLSLAYRHLDRARELAREQGDRSLAVEALDALAQLYEDHHRNQDALILTQQAIEQAHSLAPGAAARLLIDLEWRQARLLQAGGREAPALAAYQRAVSHLESVRQDIPIEYEDGRSSFQATLEPIYLGYTDLLLRQLDKQPAEVQAAQLPKVLNALEWIRQAELQDFLGDRCAVEAAHGSDSARVPPGTAVLYPVILPDRLELLLQTSGGIQRRSTAIDGATLRATAQTLADALRNGLEDYREPARQLNDWLLKPFADAFAAQHIDSLVLVPEGALRLVPMAALHDGQQFVIEKYAVSMVTGMTMTHTAVPAGQMAASLVVGLSEPGPVVDKHSQLLSEQIQQSDSAEKDRRGKGRGLARTIELRSMRGLRSAAPSGQPSSRQIEDLRASLTLPGVKEEIEALRGILHGNTLLDAQFTVGNLHQQAESGDYQIVHIASHGVFGGSAETSFIMAYDDLISMNGLQGLLQAEKLQSTPIELLSLSACETAEGNDRAPLGISGAAIKARARSVLGTLWPVADEVAKAVMKSFYSGIANAHLSKTEALRRAQLEWIRHPDWSHPFYWAPFIIIGNWL
ncbi:CHAT domain-containing protein [Candidatus Accumulibacter contiguus]|jgi:CHAT domain-containing protein|uniref:CHAT domain-containing protein n=1 Tax=Candidatus Accumulibacter contiguus TaxID=2954381 RepID=A0ABX1TDW7_9PROT|nr:CHAT domain-containing protein [Candidatus Accumulibacter contiguus]NMQ07895.1 CHAT domain-containing protein [Candidatus Accumulibacter contiguus]